MNDDELFQELMEPVYANVSLEINSTLAAYRITVCRQCVMFKNFACTECGCSVFTKARKEQESCPLGKW